MRSAYFTLEKVSDRSECEKLLNDYKIGKEIGKGAYGKVYDVCQDKDCNFVLKTMEFCKSKYDMIGVPKLSYEYKYDGWRKEIENQLKVIECSKKYDYKFVPYVHDAWFCHEKNGDSTFYIVMEKFDGDLKSLIKKFSKHDIDVKNLLKSFIMLKFEVLGKALEYINNSCGICLDDIKLENILYKKYSDNNTYDLVFSDFGTSLFGNNLTTKCIELDIMRFKQAVEDFGNTF